MVVAQIPATFLDGPWDEDGTQRWVEDPPPPAIEAPGGTTYRLVDASGKIAIYQDTSAEG
jgi:hypothetical protein